MRRVARRPWLLTISSLILASVGAYLLVPPMRAAVCARLPDGALRPLAAVTPWDEVPLMAQARRAYCEGDYVSAADHAQQALNRGESSGECWEMIARGRLVRADFPGALEAATRAVQLDPGLPAAHRIKGLAHAAVRDNARAVASLLEATRLDPDDLEAWTAIEALARGTDDTAWAEATDRLAQAAPDDVNRACRAAATWLDIGDAEAALHWAERAIELAPHRADAHLMLAASLLRLNRTDEALREARQSLRLEPALHLAHYVLGQALLRSGQADQAVAELETAQRELPHLPEISLELSRAYFALGRKEEGESARRLYNQALDAKSQARDRGQLSDEPPAHAPSP